MGGFPPFIFLIKIMSKEISKSELVYKAEYGTYPEYYLSYNGVDSYLTKTNEGYSFGFFTSNLFKVPTLRATSLLSCVKFIEKVVDQFLLSNEMDIDNYASMLFEQDETSNFSEPKAKKTIMDVTIEEDEEEDDEKENGFTFKAAKRSKSKCPNSYFANIS